MKPTWHLDRKSDAAARRAVDILSGVAATGSRSAGVNAGKTSPRWRRRAVELELLQLHMRWAGISTLRGCVVVRKQGLVRDDGQDAGHRIIVDLVNSGRVSYRGQGR